jgi:hypothetical protein
MFWGATPEEMHVCSLLFVGQAFRAQGVRFGFRFKQKLVQLGKRAVKGLHSRHQSAVAMACSQAGVHHRRVYVTGGGQRRRGGGVGSGDGCAKALFWVLWWDQQGQGCSTGRTQFTQIIFVRACSQCGVPLSVAKPDTLSNSAKSLRAQSRCRCGLVNWSLPDCRGVAFLFFPLPRGPLHV